MIPFSSEIKFNLYIRDMAKREVQLDSENANSDLMVVMKGAPERVLSRCSKILINGKEEALNGENLKKVNSANEMLGKMGERVLAIARCNLDPEIFTKTPPYPFDVKNWKEWIDVRSYEDAKQKGIKGWFPMFNLTLVGLVSLNDPPRPKVAQSVSMCKEAGIRVIMVTGDQPPTAAAIAHKVNII